MRIRSVQVTRTEQAPKWRFSVFWILAFGLDSSTYWTPSHMNVYTVRENRTTDTANGPVLHEEALLLVVHDIIASVRAEFSWRKATRDVTDDRSSLGFLVPEVSRGRSGAWYDSTWYSDLPGNSTRISKQDWIQFQPDLMPQEEGLE